MSDTDAQVDAVRSFPRFALGGGRHGSTLSVGAPRDLSDLADAILADLNLRLPVDQCPGKSDLYLIAFRAMLSSQADRLLSAHARVMQVIRHDRGQS